MGRARTTRPAPLRSRCSMSGFHWTLLDGRRPSLARDFVLRTGSARAADRTDQLSLVQQRDSAARGNSTVEGEHVVILFQLNAVLHDASLAPEARGRSGLVF